MANKRMLIPTKPNSCPLKGKNPSTAVADPKPINDVKTTDPHDAQPTPNILVATPKTDIPIDC